NAIGGTLRLTALDGGTVQLDATGGYGQAIGLDATGGAGGRGGFGTGYGATGGPGGAGGAGTAGTLELIAGGGTITTGDLAIAGSGIGGTGGAGLSATGATGIGTGGVVRLVAGDASGTVPAGAIVPGSIVTGQITATLNGLAGTADNAFLNGGNGLFELVNQSARGDATVRTGLLALDIRGNAQPVGRGFTVVANRGLVRIGGGFVGTSGTALVAAGDTGRLDIGGDFSLDAATIAITHSRPVGATAGDTIRADGPLFFTTGGYTADAGTVIRSADGVTILSDGDILSDGAIVAQNRIALTADGALRVRDALAEAPVTRLDTGYGVTVSGGEIDLRAGSGEAQRNFDLTVTGTVSGTLATRLTGGGSVIVADGGTVRSANLVRVTAGDDIRVAAGGAIRGATDPYEDDGAAFETQVGTAGVDLRAGGLTLDYEIADNVNTILVDGTLDAGQRALAMRAGGTFDFGGTRTQPGAIVVRDAIRARSLIADIVAVPAIGDPRDDSGRLPAGCFAGSVCLGIVNTTRTLAIGGDPDIGVPTRVTLQGDLDNDQTIIRANDTIALGGTGASIVGRDLLSIQSLAGAVTLAPGTTLRGGAGGEFGGLVQIAGAQGISGPGATIDAGTAALGLYTGSGDLTLAALRAGVVQTLDADLGVVRAAALELPGSVSIDALSLGLADIDVTAGGSVRIGTAATPGVVSLRAEEGRVSLGTANEVAGVTLIGNGVDFGTIATSGGISAVAGNGGIAGGIARANGDILLTASDAVGVDEASTDGTLTIRTAGTLTLGTARGTTGVDLDAAGTITIDTLTGGPIFVHSLSDLNVGSASAVGDLQFDIEGGIVATSLTAEIGYGGGGAIALGAGGTIGVTNLDAATTASLGANGGIAIAGTAQAGTALMLMAGGDVTAGTLVAGTDAEVTSETGAIDVDRVRAGGDIILDGAGSVQVRTDVATPGAVTARGGAVALNALDTLAIAEVTARSGGVSVESGGDLAVGSARAAGSILLVSGGNLALANATTQPVPLRVAIDPVGAAGRGDITLRAATGATISGTVDARDDVIVGTGGLAQIGVTSGDIAIAEGAVIGRGLDTVEVAFTNGAAGTATVIGTGIAATGGYSLDTTELGIVAAQTVRILAPNLIDGDQPEVTVGDLTFTGSAGSAAGRLYGDAASLSIETPGRIRVLGDVLLSGSATGDLLAFDAGRSIEVVTPDGSIRMADTAGANAGTLRLAADRILVTSAAAAADLATLADTDARDERLGQVDGPARPDGYLAANGLDFRVGSALYVQNSGVAGDRGSANRAGFTAGPGGVTITTTGASPASVIVNGRIVDADGTVTGGAAVIPRLVIRGSSDATPATLDPRSTANGCLIASGTCRFDVPTPTPVPPTPTPVPPTPTPVPP
ncbi:MAG: hypothetical protein ABW128_01310, partial [Rhizorhabdus sp.]